ADPLNNKISNESPIGQALLNRKKGDVISINTPRGNVDYKIIKIG
ncbi:MAG: GreA/GreB family elongation factor, partial [Candidatus Falkowbacteria bacterium]|nr:GreA/GreB family elongation factor [Candidatus Falkowbacteria bacterium]